MIIFRSDAARSPACVPCTATNKALHQKYRTAPARRLDGAGGICMVRRTIAPRVQEPAQMRIAKFVTALSGVCLLATAPALAQVDAPTTLRPQAAPDANSTAAILAAARPVVAAHAMGVSS